MDLDACIRGIHFGVALMERDKAWDGHKEKKKKKKSKKDVYSESNFNFCDLMIFFSKPSVFPRFPVSEEVPIHGIAY